MIKDNALHRYFAGFHIFSRQHHRIDGSKSRVGDHQTGQTSGPDKIFKLDLLPVKTERAENPAGPFRRNILILAAHIVKILQHAFHFNRVSFKFCRKMGRDRRFINIRTHLFKRLFGPGHCFHL